MKKTTYTIIASIVLAGSMAVAAQAQTARPAPVRVSIPFQFNVGNATMPAGEYLIRQLTADANASTLQISRQDGSANVLVNVIGEVGQTQAMSKLTFHRYGNQYYFAEVWIDGEQDGLQAPRSKAERATQKETAALNIPMESVAVKLR
ncbi:MAG TPA: hypothetical protein VE961_12590 [Pyrinomonadaceae bacterium]|nr:hypothetical protein [Pyrinomonadaceae bacterium]